MLFKTFLILFLVFQFSSATDWLKPFYGLWGIGGSYRQSIYNGESDKIGAAPFIFGGYGRLSIEANRAAYTFYGNGTWFSSAVAQLRSHQLRSETHPAGERTSAIEVGLQVGRHLPGGLVGRLAFLQDVSGKHKSWELDGQLFRHDFVGPVTILSAIGLLYQSDGLRDYYFSSDAYKSSNGWVGELEVIATWRIGSYGLFGGTRLFIFDDAAADSPLSNGRSVRMFFAGLGVYL